MGDRDLHSRDVTGGSLGPPFPIPSGQCPPSFVAGGIMPGDSNPCSAAPFFFRGNPCISPNSKRNHPQTC